MGQVVVKKQDAVQGQPWNTPDGYQVNLEKVVNLPTTNKTKAVLARFTRKEVQVALIIDKETCEVVSKADFESQVNAVSAKVCRTIKAFAGKLDLTEGIVKQKMTEIFRQ